MQQSSLPLSGIKIVDFTHVYQGPVATQLLADYGADVIKVERQGSGDWSRAWGPFTKGVSLPYANLNRNKRSMAIDMKSPEGIKAVKALIEGADVLVHNFRLGVLEKLGLGYEEVVKNNPKVIYASSSGWGDRGPNVDKNRAGHDMMARAEGGWFIQGENGQAPFPGGISVDYPAGLMLTIGILTALMGREKSGQGQRVTTDLLSVALHAHAWDAASELNNERIDQAAKVGGTEKAINKSFLTSNGAIEISPVFSDNSLRDISTALDLEDLSTWDAYKTEDLQIQNREQLNAKLAEVFITKTTEHWLDSLEKSGVLCAKINTFLEAANEEQTAINQMVVPMDHPKAGQLKVLGNPLRLHSTPPRLSQHAPDLGENSKEILKELNYSDQDIQRFEIQGTIN